MSNTGYHLPVCETTTSPHISIYMLFGQMIYNFMLLMQCRNTKHLIAHALINSKMVHGPITEAANL